MLSSDWLTQNITKLLIGRHKIILISYWLTGPSDRTRVRVSGEESADGRDQRGGD